MQDTEHRQHLRHVSAPHRTTIKLENEFWLAIDRLAGKTGRTWSEWAAKPKLLPEKVGENLNLSEPHQSSHKANFVRIENQQGGSPLESH